MKVLHVTPSYFPATSYGGPIESTHKLCLALADKGVDVKVLTTDSDGPARLAQSGKTVEYTAKLGVEYCPRSFGDDFSFTLLRKLPSAIRSADVIHLTAVYSFTTIPTLFFARVLGKPVVWSPRGSLKHWEETTRKTAKSIWERLSLLVSGKVMLHCTSEDEAESARKRLEKTSGRKVAILVAPNGIDVTETRKMPRENELRLLFLGRLDPIKGIEHLIDACKLLAERGLKFRVRIAGTGDGNYVAVLKARAAAGTGIELLGYADEAKKRELFANTDLLVLPSHTENFGMSVAEALANGVAVVASKGTPWQQVEAHGCGKWVENTPKALADAIVTLEREDLVVAGERGRTWMRAEFAWPRIADAMVDVYKQALRA